MDKLPCYEMIIDESPESDVEVSFVALVPKPAIEKNFMFFDEDKFGGPGSGPQGGDGGGEDEEDVGDDVKASVSKALPEIKSMSIGSDGGYRERATGKNKSGEKVVVSKQTEKTYRVASGNKIIVANENNLQSVLHKEGVTGLVVKGVQMSQNFTADPARQIISGPAMVPDTLIFRKDAGGEYNVYFSKKTIEDIAIKFFKKDYHKNINLFHDPKLSVQGVTIFEAFVSDQSRGIQPMKGYEDLPDGTLFISAKVENPDVWSKIQSGEVKGFSVEGIFSYTKKPKVVEDQIAEILNRTYNADSHLKLNDIMSTVKDMVAKFKKTFFDGTPLVAPVVPAPPVVPVASPQVLQTDYTLKDGTAVTVDKLEVGGVMLISGVPAPPGDHELADGTKVTVGEGGVISAVTPSMAAALPVAASITMAQVEQAIQAAISSFKQEMAAERLAATQKLEASQKIIKDQDTKIAGLFDIVEELVKIPTADPVGENQLSFSKQKNTSKEEKRATLVSYFQKLKSKTA